MIDRVRLIEKICGDVTYEITPKKQNSRKYARSLFVAKDVKAGDILTEENVRSVRPSNGLAPKELDKVLGREFSEDAEAGTPLSWNIIK